MMFGQLLEAVLQSLSQHTRVLLKPVLVDDVEYSETGRHADRISAKRVEVNALRQRLCDLHPRGDRAKRNPVADALRHSDEVRHHVEVLESPIVITGASKPCLNFIS